ncbi:hormogonium polysaccharide secretion pseudopilin HpsB [Nostoc sp. TCL26-01]|uniref:hormogonium polysaccharide secretion pseudopilin HpsB n=1 Tax=Nostoc sp. TCL26-01 TaxID=2576904 RepID=UPI0015BC152B|nr:hormogonium polysaccharide secretion pseudopilin HpsB [Nostoc sp. TCL26-01]QLE57199.1 type II secretion system protein [Nostoc sp. TCL26-01]
MIRKQASKQRLYKNRVRKKALSSEQGFTIVESLVAIIVVGILLVAIAPVLSLSVATRVQSRRVELATQAARSYIDAVRAKKIDSPTASTADISTFAAPTPSGSFSCNTNSYCTNTSTSPLNTPTNLYCIDFDNLPVSTASPPDPPKCEHTSSTDMVIQAFRYNSVSGSTASNGYILGVRVYRADAFKSSISLRASKDYNDSQSLTLKKQAIFTAGIGQRITPLVEMTTEISDTVPKYSDLCARVGGCN